MWFLVSIVSICIVSILAGFIESPRKWKPKYDDPVSEEERRRIRSYAGCGLIIKHTIVSFRFDDQSDDWRSENSSEVRYAFLCLFLLPIIPVGCYRVRSRSDEILSRERWSLSEVFHVYFQTAVVILSIFWIGGEVLE